MRASWLLYEQSLPGEDDEQLARAEILADRLPADPTTDEIAISALRAFLDDRSSEVPGLLDAWDPEPTERALKARMRMVAQLSAISRGSRSWRGAVTVARADYAADPLPRLGLFLSRVLVGSAYAEPTDDRTDHLVDAYDVAVQVRDTLRAARAPSLPAVIAAVEAAEMLGDEKRVLRVATDWDDFAGEANREERGSPRTAQAVVAAALVLGHRDRALNHAEALPSGYERALCFAMCHDLPNTQMSPDERRAMWNDVLAVARTTQERLPAWDGLARGGAVELPGLREELSETRPALVASLEAAATAARGFHDEAVHMLLPYARTDVTAARQLAKIYADHGEQINAARMLLEAGTDFHNPDLELHAADLLCDNGEYAEARTVVERLLATYGSEWAGRAAALRVAARIAEATSRLDAACEYLAAAVRLEPANVDGRWYLIQLLCQRGRSEEAWATIKAASDELPIRNVNEARAWLVSRG
jgi:hypothetical protein